VGDDYLWDGSGTPDSEVERLERVLRPLRHDRPAPAFPQAPAPPRRTWGWAAAAAVVVALGSLSARSPSPDAGWDVARLAGQPRVGATVVASQGRLGPGEWLETDATSEARLSIGTIGSVELGPRTRVRLVDAGHDSHRLALDRGTMHARIWARPGQFFVDTPSATAVDLGCMYTLTVDDAGAGVLSVDMGWVAFAFEGRESFVPAGARCPTRRDRGPGTPYFVDAPEGFRSALAQIDFGAESERAAALDAALELARPADGVSLWHLLGRVGAAERSRVYERLAGFVAPPAGVTRDGILQGDRRMLDLWWNALGLESASFWRSWERPWAPPTHATRPAR
jgi:hypothetical protein